MAPPKQIRSLDRGLDVLEALARHGAQSLADLSRHTGLAKSSLRRILTTLEARRFVRRSLGDQLYRTNIGAPISRAIEQQPRFGRLAAIASPYLEELTRAVVWPSDLLVRNGAYMEIVETSRTRTPLLVNRNEIGDRVDIVISAVGRAYLAVCSQAEREDVFAAIDREGWSKPGRIGISRAMVEDELQATRIRGYGVRQPGFTGATSRWPQTNDRLQAIALAINDGEQVFGCVNLLWPREVMSTADFADRHLPDLQTAVTSIARAYVD